MSREVEQDGAITLYPNLEQPPQEIWETEDFITGMSWAIRGGIAADYPNNGSLPGIDFDGALFMKGWNFGNAIINPILARIEMEKD